MNKIWQKTLSMSLGKKIYAILWLITSFTLIAFIAVVVSLNSKVSSEKVPNMAKPYGYEVTTRAKPGETLPRYEDIQLTDAQLKAGVDKTHYADVIAKVHNLKDAITTLHAAEIYDLTLVKNNEAVAAGTAANGDKTPAEYYFTLGKWQQTMVPTESGAFAQNSIAASGLVFGISMIASVFTTVGVQVAAKRAKGGKK